MHWILSTFSGFQSNIKRCESNYQISMVNWSHQVLSWLYFNQLSIINMSSLFCICNLWSRVFCFTQCVKFCWRCKVEVECRIAQIVWTVNSCYTLNLKCTVKFILRVVKIWKIEGFEVGFSLQVFCFNFALYVIDQRLVMIAMLGSKLVCKKKYKSKQVKRGF